MEAQLRWESRAHLDHLAALGVLLALYAHALIQTLLPQQPPPGPPIAAPLCYPPCQRSLLKPQSPLHYPQLASIALRHLLRRFMLTAVGRE